MRFWPLRIVLGGLVPGRSGEEGFAPKAYFVTSGLSALPRLLYEYSTCLLCLLTFQSCLAGFSRVDQEKSLSDTSEVKMSFTDHFVPSALEVPFVFTGFRI
jgi:hypothetical protein